MNSFAFWCRPNEGGGKDRVDGQGIEAMVNINLWIADSLEHGKSSTTAFDFGLMLSPACSDGQDDGKAGDTAQGDEKSEDLKGDVSILDSIKGISLYCPFKIDKSCFSDLMPKLNKETLGAIFNDRCRVSEVDFTSRYVEVNLANDESRGRFSPLRSPRLAIPRGARARRCHPLGSWVWCQASCSRGGHGGRSSSSSRC